MILIQTLFIILAVLVGATLITPSEGKKASTTARPKAGEIFALDYYLARFLKLNAKKFPFP